MLLFLGGTRHMDEPAAMPTSYPTSTVDACAQKGSPSQHGFLPSSSIQSRHSDNEKSASVTTTDPFLQVEVLSPPILLNHLESSQPVTPSPQASSAGSTLHDNYRSGWTARGLSTCSNHNDFCSERKRIGYDGTAQTPSMQLLKPTASSLGHQVSKAARRTHPPTTPASSPKTMIDNNENSIFTWVDSSVNGFQRQCCASDMRGAPLHESESEHHSKKMAYTAPYASPMNPFGKLGKSVSTRSGSITSEEDEGMMMLGQYTMSPNNSSADATMEEGLNHNLPGYTNITSRPGLHRRASWSQGSKQSHPRKRGFSGSCREEGDDNARIICPERLRSCIIDPVASQLLRECAFHDDDEEEEDYDFDSTPLLSSSTVSETVSPSVSREEEAHSSCHSSSSKQSFHNGSFFRYSSMPDLFRSSQPNHPTTTSTRDGNDFALPSSKEASYLTSANNYPLSPEPLFRSVSDRLLDVKTKDDIKSLARPVPRKLSAPNTTCVLPLPRRFGVLNCHEP